MWDESGVSLSASDPNPTIDQFDDGGSSADYSGIISSVGQWGTEIASMVTGNPSPARAPYYAPSGGGPFPRVAPPMSNNTKLLLVGLGVAAAVVLIHVMGAK